MSRPWRKTRGRSRAVLRALQLLALINGRRQWIALCDLADQLDCCHRTIRRDLQMLEELGLDVQWSGHQGKDVPAAIRVRWTPRQLSALVAA